MSAARTRLAPTGLLAAWFQGLCVWDSPGRSYVTYLMWGSEEPPGVKGSLFRRGLRHAGCLNVMVKGTSGLTCESHYSHQRGLQQAPDPHQTAAHRAPGVEAWPFPCQRFWRYRKTGSTEPVFQKPPYTCQDRTHTQRPQVPRFLLDPQGHPTNCSPSLVTLPAQTKHLVSILALRGRSCKPG